MGSDFCNTAVFHDNDSVCNSGTSESVSHEHRCSFIGYLFELLIYPNLPKLLYIGFKLIPQIPYKIGV